ncbi:LamG domain-containing protein [Acinetobacter bohemicus]|uniref:LamG domain-containing protein n=1 Tax=Acinetobacter bohemicus TaxID=1435036 RepID=UPI0040423910
MSIKIKTSWTDSNVIIEGVRIYKSLTFFDVSNRPVPLVEIRDGAEFYEDFDVVVDQTYFYMLSCFMGEQEVLTECYEVKTKQPPRDLHFNLVKVLMQFDGSSPLVDAKSGAAWELYGDASINTIDKMFGAGGALQLSDAISSYARSPILKDLYNPNISGKALTVEFFFKKTSSIGNAGAVCFQNADNLQERYAFFMRAGSTNIKCSAYTTQKSTFIDIASGANLNEWVHFAYVEGADNNSILFINGVEKIRVSANRPIVFWANTIITIGQNGLGAEPYGGLIDCLRISNYARYTGSFTPPVESFPTR